MAEKLVIAPHIDDEVLGCAGILDSRAFVYVCGVDESGFRPDKDPTPVSRRLEEMGRVAEFLGFRWECNRDTRVNRYTEHEFIDLFEDLLNHHRPEQVFLPHPGYNQDHRAVYRAALVALRPHDRNHFVPRVLVYEAAHDLLWDPGGGMEVNYFVPLDVERKIQAYRLHASQVRGMRSPELIRHIAALRGAAAGCRYAEAFRILRWCEGAASPAGNRQGSG